MLTLKTKELYDLSHTLAMPLLEDCEYPWQALCGIGEFVLSLGRTLSADEYESPCEGVWIHKSVSACPSAVIKAPCIIGRNTEIRTGAFIRGSVLVGESCVVGNSCELKNCILFDNVQVPHFNYVGDSILGFKSHMGAGSVTSNVKSDKTCVCVKCKTQVVDTGRKKFGAMLGDFVEVGCNSVLCPGTVIGKNTNIYPLSRVRGVIPSDSIYKSEGNIAEKI